MPAAARDVVADYVHHDFQLLGLGEQCRTELSVAVTLLQQFSEAGPVVRPDLPRPTSSFAAASTATAPAAPEQCTSFP